MPEPIIWFAGLVDGEGCFTVSISVQHEHSLKISLRFEIAMKLGEWSAVATDVLQSLKIPFHTRTRKNQFQITVSGTRAVKRLITILLPHLVVKRKLAKRLLGFPSALPRNRFTKITRARIGEICSIVDYVRAFNRGKNRRYKWDGGAIRVFYNE